MEDITNSLWGTILKISEPEFTDGVPVFSEGPEQDESPLANIEKDKIYLFAIYV
jgi:hypothetical protein